MPSYISHAIMGEQLYYECSKNSNTFQIPISIENLKGYSLGPDLSVLSKRLTKDPQNYHTRDFFLNMIKYIKDNNLIENSNIISLLYGHIAHYFLDINSHPLIYYIEKGCTKTGLITPHNLIEGYLSSYLSKTILNKDIMDITSNYFTEIDLSEIEVTKLLNTIYGNLYNDYQIIKTYKFTMRIFKLLEKVIKSKLISKKKLVILSQFQTFLETNNLDVSEITNESHNQYRNPITGEIFTDSFLELYEKSIDMSLEAIQEVNKSLYDSYSIDRLENIFKNLSYDTGVVSPLSENMPYVRRKQNK